MDFLKTEREKLAYLYAQYANAFNKEENEAVKVAYIGVLESLAWCLDDKAKPETPVIVDGEVIL